MTTQSSIRFGLALGVFLGLVGCGASPAPGQASSCYYTGAEIVCSGSLDDCIVEGQRDTGQPECDMAELVIASDGVTATYRLGDTTGTWQRLDCSVELRSYLGDTVLVPLKEGP